MTARLFAGLLLSLCIAVEALPQEELSLEETIARRQKWEAGWSDEWQLVSAEQAAIDHFMQGYLLTWERGGDGARLRRHDTFDQYGRLMSAHEYSIEADTVMSVAEIYVAADGWQQWRKVAMFGRPDPNHPEAGRKPLAYKLELFEDGTRVARYSAASPFHISLSVSDQGVVYGRLSEPPASAKLESGKGPSVQELASYVPEQAMGQKLLRETSALRSFAKQFAVSDEWAFRAMMMAGTDRSDSLWGAKLAPKQQTAVPCEAKVVFHFQNEISPIAWLTPEEVLDSLVEVSSGPVVRALAGKRGRVWLKAEDNRLNQDEHEARRAREFLAQHQHRNPPLAKWAELRILLDAGGMISLYHPIGTDLYVGCGPYLFDVPQWREAFEAQTGLRGLDHFPDNQYCAVIKANGDITFLKRTD